MQKRATASRARTSLRPQYEEHASVERHPHIPYLPGLDGLRAVAVLAVLLYHADIRWARGGFLGVEVFFVISGYLITALLLAEHTASGNINLGQFWLRRARRLLPAAYVLIVVVLTYAVVVLPGEVARLRGDVLVAFLYVTNWYLILGQRSYFEVVGRPSLLQHLWSLAVEEQFYLIWPVVLAWVLPRYRRAWVIGGVVLAAASSTLLMALLYRPGVDPSRVYYGTDTRAAGFLIGAALAFVWRRGMLPKITRSESLLLSAAGALGLANLAWLCWQVNSFEYGLYHGGFAWVALATAAVIAAVVHPREQILSVGLGSVLLRWIGLRSYSIYLWHWPIYMLTRPQLDLPLSGLPLLLLRFALTAALAEFSFRFVEQPVRHKAIWRAWHRFTQARGAERWELLVRWAGAAVTATTFCGMLGWSVAHARQPAPPPYLSVSSVKLANGAVMLPTAVTLPTLPPTVAPPTAELAVLPTELPTTASAQAEQQAPSAEPPTPLPAPKVFALGDSVMLGAAGALTGAYPNIEVDAQISRQMDTGIEILRGRHDSGALGDVVVVQLGNNGPLDPQQFDGMMQQLSGVRRVVVLTVKVPRPWEEPNNDIIVAGVQHYPNAVLADWHGTSVNNPGYFWDDGIHLRPEGAAAYTNLVMANIGP